MKTNIPLELGKRIRTLRRLRKLTIEKLGEKSGISYKFIGEIERGVANPSLDTLASIADALGININALFPAVGDVDHQLSSEDIRLIKKALRLLNKSFSNF
jgi:transcriptional regulator with XRE-family HTH domain